MLTRRSGFLCLVIGGLMAVNSGWAQHPGPYFHVDAGVSIVQDLNGTFADIPGKM